MAITDPEDSLYLHPSDSPGTLLVIEKFEGTGFEAWKRAMKVALYAKNKISFIDGTSKRPEPTDPKFQQWEPCNNMVIAWIIHALSKSIAGSVHFSTSAYEIWRHLEQRYGKSDGAKLFEIHKELCSISQAAESITDYFTRIKSLWDELSAVFATPSCTCGKCVCDVNKRLSDQQDKLRLIQFLMGLNETYTTARGTVLMMKPLPRVSEAFSVLVQEERQREVHSTPQFLDHSASSFNAGRPNFQRENKQDRRLNQNVQCNYCKKPGHTIDKCYRLHGFPADFKFAKGKKVAAQVDVESQASSSSSSPIPVIQGNSVENIGKASNRIQNVLDEAVKSPNLDYSHFISLPLAIHPELVNKLVRFQNFILGDDTKDDFEDIDDDDTSEETLEDEGARKQSGKEPSVAVSLQVQDNNNHVKVDLTNIPITSYQPKASKSPTLSDLGIDRSIFIKPNTFHLTVLMLKLWNQERVDTATKVLQNVSSVVLDALESRPVAVRLKGLECMRGSLSKARVLYVPVEEIGDEGRLLRACQVIIGAFVEAGLVLEKDARHKLKLHATVMNTSHRKKTRWAKKNDSFDARGIYERYGSELWGEYGIREAHLSQRHIFDDNGYYHCCAAIPFPQNMSAD